MQLSVFNSTSEISQYITDSIISLTQSKEGVVSIALSGGNTPKAMFQYWKAHITEIPWHRLAFYWVDERCVAQKSSESNYGEAKRIVFNFIGHPAPLLYPINGANDAELEAEFISLRVKHSFPDNHSIPKFDLILLGVGTDGHTASIFPNNMDLLTDKRIYATSTHPASNQKRITLTGTVINNAQNVFFIVTGADKKEILQAIISQNQASKNYPAACLCPKHNVEWIVDKIAYDEQR